MRLLTTLNMPRTRVETVEDPAWDAVESAIRDLDGVHRTEVAVLLDDGTRIFVSGGHGGCIFQIGKDDAFFVMKGPGEDQTPRRIERGGFDDFPDELVVPVRDAILAARTWWDRRELDARFRWNP